MTIDGALRQVYETTKAAEAKAAAEESRRQELARRSFLGRTILKISSEKVPRMHSFARFGLPEERSQRFKKLYELPDDFPTDKLQLKVSPNYESWVHWELTHNLDDEQRKIARFNVVAIGSENSTDPETLMAWNEDGQWMPVRFEDQNYRTIRQLSGLFMPEIEEILVAGGQ